MNTVKIEIALCAEIVKARRAELARRRENQRLVLDVLPESEAGQVDLGDLDSGGDVGLTTKQLMDAAIKTVQEMSPAEKEQLKKSLESK